MSPEQIYASPWHHPGLLLPLALAGSAFALSRLRRVRAQWSPFLRVWLVAWGAEIVLDAALTGFASPLRGHPGAERAASIAFVILGDLRAYLLLERLSSPTRPWAAAAARALGYSLVASLAVAAAARLAPSGFAPARHVYLLYEVLSVGLFALWRAALIPRPGPALARDVATFFLVQYALWAGCDALILAGVDAAYLLRIVPNALYYGLFVAFVAWRATRGPRP